MKTNWPVKKLGEVAEIRSGYGFPVSIQGNSDGEIPFYKVGDMNLSGNEIFMVSHNNALTRSQVEKLRFRTIPKDSIIFPKIGGAIGTNKKRILTRDSLFDNNVMALVPNGKVIDPLYLYHWLQNFNLVNWASDSTLPSINKSTVEKQEIPVPGIEEQKRIVKKLEKILAKIEETSISRQESSEEAQNIIRTKLGELFENNSWDETRVSDIAEKPQYGYTAPSAKDKIGPRLLRITDIQNGMVDWENVPYCKCNEIDKYRLTSGDIVFARTGATTGKSFLIKDTPEQTVFASYLIRLKTKGGIKQEFLYWFFQSPQYWDQIMGHQRGSAQPNVNAVTLSTIKLRMPENLKEQDKIVEYLDGLSEKVQKLQRLQQEQLQELEALQQSVLHQAFQGELVDEKKKEKN